MICNRVIPKTTLKKINTYCINNIHDFRNKDIISIYSPMVKVNKEGESKPKIEKKDYWYDYKEDQFI